MKSFALFAAICAVALSAGAMKTANAATITETDNFTASGFTSSGSPVDPWTGAFTITFDPTVSSSGALNAFSSSPRGAMARLHSLSFHKAVSS